MTLLAALWAIVNDPAHGIAHHGGIAAGLGCIDPDCDCGEVIG